MIDKLKFLLSSVYAFLLPLIKELLTTEGKILAKTALEAVRAAEAIPNATGKEKAAYAFAVVKERMLKEGLTVASRLINAAIEAAVLNIKSK